MCWRALGVVLSSVAISFSWITSAEATVSPSINSDVNAEPAGLTIAIKVVLEWWQKRAAAFPEIQVSPPLSEWKMFEDRAIKDLHKITYAALAGDAKDNWFASTNTDCPNQWVITMPTNIDCTVTYSVFVEPISGQAHVWEVRFSYRTVSL
jgi:hypothetical protein